MTESAEVILESVEFTFPMWLKMHEENGSLLEFYSVDPKVIQALVAYMNYEISDRKAAESFAPALLERYKQLAKAKSQTPSKWASVPGCPPALLEYHEETLNRHLQLLMDAATQILHHQTQDSLVKLISAMQQEALSQLKVYGALRQDYECASKLPGLEESLGEEDLGEPFNHFFVASIVPWKTDLSMKVARVVPTDQKTSFSSWLDFSQCILRPPDRSETMTL